MPSIRIIAGQLRKRAVQFPPLPNIRPTPIRIRETVFNWLMQDITEAYCLDLFAGSGALGFEAYSRAAKKVVMVESSQPILQALENNRARFQAHSLIICPMHFPRQADRLLSLGPFHIVFLDPPFASNLLTQSCDWLFKTPALLAPKAQIYIETDQPFTTLALPSNWVISRQKKAGQVYYGLIHPHTTQ